MHLRDRGCVRTLRPLFVYATGSTPRYVYKKSFSLSLKSLHDVASLLSITFICPAAAGNATYHIIGDRAFAVAGPRAWNNHYLSDFITDCSPSRTFKQHLKTY